MTPTDDISPDHESRIDPHVAVEPAPTPSDAVVAAEKQIGKCGSLDEFVEVALTAFERSHPGSEAVPSGQKRRLEQQAAAVWEREQAKRQRDISTYEPAAKPAAVRDIM